MIEPAAKLKPENSGEKHEIQRDEKGRIKAGTSGNPKGKPKGTKNKFTISNLQALDDAVREFSGYKKKNFWEGSLELGVKLAKKGNTMLLCKIMDKLVGNKTVGETLEDPPEELPFLVRTFGNGAAARN